MSSKFWISVRVLFVGVLLLALSRPAAASTVTYTETIEDLNFATFFDLFDFTRDLTRTRTLGDGTVQVETDDATIVSENALSDNWGLSTFTAIGWNHLYDFVPPVEIFLRGSVTLNVIGVDPSTSHPVFIEFFPVGDLTPGGTDVESTTTFSTDGLADPNFVLSLELADNALHVEIFPLLADVLTIRSSTAELTYTARDEGITAVPEPASAVLLLSGLAAGGWRRYRSRQV